jgi:hypothetical protein
MVRAMAYMVTMDVCKPFGWKFEYLFKEYINKS